MSSYSTVRRLSFWFMGGLALLPLAVIAWILTAPLRDQLHPASYGACVVGGAIALHGVLTFAESRGWIYYRKRAGSYGGLGVTSEWLNLYDPSRKHLQIATRVREWKREEDDDGDGTGPLAERDDDDSRLIVEPDA